MNPLTNVVMQQLLGEELTVKCETCNETYFIGTAKTYAVEMAKHPPPPFYINALRHAWNNPSHNVAPCSSNKLLNHSLGQYANISAFAKRIKELNPHKADLPFDSLKHGFQGTDGTVKGGET